MFKKIIRRYKLGKHIESNIKFLPTFTFTDNERIILKKQENLITDFLGKIHILEYMPNDSKSVYIVVKDVKKK